MYGRRIGRTSNRLAPFCGLQATVSWLIYMARAAYERFAPAPRGRLYLGAPEHDCVYEPQSLSLCPFVALGRPRKSRTCGVSPSTWVIGWLVKSPLQYGFAPDLP